MQKNRAFMYLQILTVILVMAKVSLPQSTCQSADEKVWYVHDVIDPSPDEVKWLEEGAIDEAPRWISDGSWYQASIRQSLINANDIFVSTYELFNWSHLSSSYGLQYDSFYDFAKNVTANPSQWLGFSWQIDAEWYGVPLDRTKVSYTYNETTSNAELSTWFHITRVPEYFVGEGRLESWLTGFDLTPISTGSLRTWELYKDYNKYGSTYNLYFKAPANILSQHGDNFTLRIGVASSYQGYIFKIQQVIDINMPPNTEIREATPSNMSLLRGNTATFVIAKGDTYPASFTVVSGPPTKSLSQTVWESASVWFLTPGGWAAIASLLVLSYTGLRGRRIWGRNRMYHRLYKSMVTLYDLYSRDLPRFHQEMDNMSKSIIRMLVEDRITDEQFEKLLKRRDDLVERSDKLQPPAPPKP